MSDTPQRPADDVHDGPTPSGQGMGGTEPSQSSLHPLIRNADAGDRVEQRLVPPENIAIAGLLEEISDLLSHQGASEFRVRAYQSASEMLRDLQIPIREVFDHEGIDGLICLPTIGQSIAHLIEHYLQDGTIPLLDRLRGDETAERVFATLPGIGPELAHRIHEMLEVETLPELMAALADGRLQKVPGMGKKRLRSLRESLTMRLRHPENTFQPPTDVTESTEQDVPINELLDIDAEYRRLASQGKLPKIAPIRFNPEGTAWLPILHTHRGKRHYTAFYSNTARAHELNTTKDWVVIYRDDGEAHGRWTVITSQFGTLRGWRIVRGREEDCEAYYIHDEPDTRGTHPRS